MKIKVFQKIFRFLPLFFLLLSLLIGLLLVWPSYKQIKSLKQQVLRQKTLLNSQKANLNELYKIKETFEQTKLEFEKINQFLK